MRAYLKLLSIPVAAATYLVVSPASQGCQLCARRLSTTTPTCQPATYNSPQYVYVPIVYSVSATPAPGSTPGGPHPAGPPTTEQLLEKIGTRLDSIDGKLKTMEDSLKSLGKDLKSVHDRLEATIKKLKEIDKLPLDRKF
jgi:hypothetical protein